MTDSTIINLPANTTPATTDVIPHVDDPAGTPVDKKMTFADFLKVVNGLTEDTAPDSLADFALVYDTSASAAKKIKISRLGLLKNSVASVTTANVTGVVGTRHILDVSGMTANRNFVLPAGAAGDVIEVNLSVGDATYELILIGDTGITITGGATVTAAATEWSRIFITGEVVQFVATSATNWNVVKDGRISCVAVLRRTGSDSNTTHDATDFIHSTWNAAAIDVGGCADLTGVRIKARRAGKYRVSSAYAPVAAITDQNYAAIQIWLDATVTSGEITAGTRVASAALRQSSSSSVFGAAIPGKPVSATAGQYFYQSFSAQEANRGLLASDTASPTTLIEVNFFSVEEILPK